MEKFKAKKGQFCSALWIRPIETLKNKTLLNRGLGETAIGKALIAGKTIQKVVQAHGIRAGAGYDNLQAVKDKRETGELPAKNAGLDWAEWIDYPHHFKHKTKGQEYIRFSLTDKSSFGTKFLLDGNPVTRDEIKEFCQSGEVDNKEVGTDVISLKVEYIVSLD